MEQQLNELDQDERTAYFLSSRRSDQNDARKKLLVDIERKLFRYNALLEAYYRQIERTKPSQRNIKSVAYWIKAHKPLAASESEFLTDWNDLIAPEDVAKYGFINVFAANFMAAIKSKLLSKVS
ncbi:hypothetical protein MMC30_006686 [Trapelia coarctata]|nr:hypothetical protein [Trapelia coarctata]